VCVYVKWLERRRVCGTLMGLVIFEDFFLFFGEKERYSSLFIPFLFDLQVWVL
jgi:hypothetical protein